MRVLVCGGRSVRNRRVVWSTLNRWHQRHRFTAFMQGGQVSFDHETGEQYGVDYFAKEWARLQPELDGKRYECKAEWKRYGRRAGPLRNARMIEWRPDVVIAFAGGAGTADMVRKARAAGIYVAEVKM